MGIIYLQELAQRQIDARAKYFDQVFDILRAVGQTQPNVKKISEHIFLVRFSDLVGKPWNVNYHSWSASAESIIDYAKKKQYPLDYIDYLKQCRRKAKNDVVKIGDSKNNFIVQVEFLDRVLAEKKAQDAKITAREVDKQKYIYLVFEHQSIDEFNAATRLLCATDKYSKANKVKKDCEDELADCFKQDFWYEVVKEEII